MRRPPPEDLRAKVFEDRITRGDWRVEKMDDDGGYEVVKVFAGSDAREQAIQYAERDFGVYDEIRLEPYRRPRIGLVRQLNVDLRYQNARLMKSQPGAPMTLGNAAEARVRLIVWCKACGHQVEPDPAEMAQQYGAAIGSCARATGAERSIWSSQGSRVAMALSPKINTQHRVYLDTIRRYTLLTVERIEKRDTGDGYWHIWRRS